MIHASIDFSAGLTFTRTKPPTIEELTTDRDRVQALNPRIAAIEERERLERIRQGYLVESSSEGAGTVPQARISEPSFYPAPSIPSPPSASDSPSTPPTRPPAPPHSPSNRTTGQTGSYHVPTLTSPGVAETKATVDPSHHSSPEELRKLAEEDTKRRMKESGVEDLPPPTSHSGGEDASPMAGIKPRRRGGA